MSVCVSSAGGTLGIDAMSLSQMTLPSSMMLPLAHSSSSLGSGHSSLLSHSMANGQTSLGTIGSLDGGGLSIGSTRSLQLNSASSSSNNSSSSSNSNGHGSLSGGSLTGLPALHGQGSTIGAGLSGELLGDHHPNPEMLLALISRNKALEGKFKPAINAPSDYPRLVAVATSTKRGHKNQYPPLGDLQIKALLNRGLPFLGDGENNRVGMSCKKKWAPK